MEGFLEDLFNILNMNLILLRVQNFRQRARFLAVSPAEVLSDNFFNTMELSDDFSGSAMLISVQCKQMVSIVKLTCFMLQYELISADCSSNSTFLQALRSAVRIAGCDNKHCIVMLQVSVIVK